MDMSTVTRNGSIGHRPSWDYQGRILNQRGLAIDTLEMLESVRNVLEAIQKSQMLQCDVAGAIYRTSIELISLNREIRGLRRDLKGRRKR